MKRILVILLILSPYVGRSQNNVGIGTSTPDSSSILDLKSQINKPQGLLIPRVSEAEKTSFEVLNGSTPATGLLLYVTDGVDANTFQYWDGTTWKIIGSDNLGDHVADQIINTNNFQISGDGDSEGISVDDNGLVKMYREPLAINPQIDYSLNVLTNYGNADDQHTNGILFGINTKKTGGKAALVFNRTDVYGIGSLHFLLDYYPSSDTVPDLNDAILTMAPYSNFPRRRVGIGTKVPRNILDVAGGAVIGSGYAENTLAPTNGLLVEGNLGIGTTIIDVPGINLKAGIATSAVGITQAHYDGGVATLEFTTEDGNGVQSTRMLMRGGSSNANVEFYRGNHGTNIETMRIDGSNGNVGIGTSSPTQAKLVVFGGISSSNTYGYLQSTGNTGVFTGTSQYSIWAEHRIAANEFHAMSDKRIKNVQGVSNSVEDLETLMGIKITDYTMKDTVLNGDKQFKKVIAQELKEVYPQAVNSTTTSIIPNIYKISSIDEKGWISVEHALRVGDRIKLITPKGDEMTRIVAMRDGAYMLETSTRGRVFVYGMEVNDFHTVDYEAVAMLNVSATQELYKNIIELEKANKSLQQQLSNQDNKITSNEEKLETLNAQLEDLKLLLITSSK